jgi:TonB family protein
MGNGENLMHHIRLRTARSLLALGVLLCAHRAWAQAADGGGAAPAPAATLPAPPPPPPPQPPAAHPDPASIEQIEQQLAAALRYPPAAKTAAEEGLSVVTVGIDRSGRILDTRLMQDSGSPALDAEALNVFKRIVAFHLSLPASQAPGQERLSVSFNIGFHLLHEGQRDPALPGDAPAGRMQVITAPISTEWRNALLAAIAGAWQRPDPMPERYKAVLRIRIDKDGHPGEVSLIQGSGNAGLDASLLDAARHADIPRGRSPALPTPQLKLCLAVPDTDCTQRDNLYQAGTTLGVFAYVPDGTAIVHKTGRFQTYLQQLGAVIAANVRYPPKSLKGQEEGNALVRVRMKRDGTITGVELIQSTRFAALNTEALTAFDRVVRFPAVPDDILPEAKDFVFQLPITFELH